MKKPLLIAAATALSMALAFPTQAFAQEAFISTSIGIYDVLRHDKAVNLRAEYRSNKPVHWDNLHPWIGIDITTDAALWAGGGLLYDWNFKPEWHLIPALGAGLYFRGSGRNNLDYPIEFRTQMEVAYDLPNTDQIGLSFSHTSNGDLGDHNPGVESLNLYYHYGF